MWPTKTCYHLVLYRTFPNLGSGTALANVAATYSYLNLKQFTVESIPGKMSKGKRSMGWNPEETREKLPRALSQGMKLCTRTHTPPHFAKCLQLLVVITPVRCYLGRDLIRDSAPGIFIGGWFCRYPQPRRSQNSTVRRNAGVQHKLFLYKQLRHSEPLIWVKFYISLGNCLPVKFPDISQELLQAGLLELFNIL